MLCPKCGAEISDNSKFCLECGAHVAVDIENGQAQRRYSRSELRELERKNPDEYYYDPSDYGENQPYNGVSAGSYYGYDDVTAEVAPRRSRVPYSVVCIIMALLGALNLLMPFLKYLSCSISAMNYSVADEKYSIFELAARFLRFENIFGFLTDGQNDYGMAELLPDEIKNLYMITRIAVIAAAGVFILALILWLVFTILSLARSKAASGFGISAAVITILLNVAVTAGITYFYTRVSALIAGLDAILSGTVTITPTPLAGLTITISCVIFVLCIVAAVLRKKLY